MLDISPPFSPGGQSSSSPLHHDQLRETSARYSFSAHSVRSTTSSRFSSDELVRSDAPIQQVSDTTGASDATGAVEKVGK